MRNGVTNVDELMDGGILATIRDCKGNGRSLRRKNPSEAAI